MFFGLSADWRGLHNRDLVQSCKAVGANPTVEGNYNKKAGANK